MECHRRDSDTLLGPQLLAPPPAGDWRHRGRGGWWSPAAVAGRAWGQETRCSAGTAGDSPQLQLDRPSMNNDINI